MISLAQEQPPLYTESELNFTLLCYHDDTFAGAAVEFPANVSRGQELYCQVSALTWDDDLELIVPECRFMATTFGLPEFVFVEDK